MGSMYAAVMFLGVQNASSVQPVVAIERTVFYREKAAGMYSELPYAFAQVTIFSLVLYRIMICYITYPGAFGLWVYLHEWAHGVIM